MDGIQLIQDAYASGRTHHDIYRPFNRLFSCLSRFIDSDYYGYSGWSEDARCYVPKHANSASNPKPALDRYGRPCRAKFRKRDLLCHLASEPSDRRPRFFFMVSSPKSPYALLTLDIDAKDSGKAHEITCDIYHDLFLLDCDFGGNVFIEPSRNLIGQYIRVIFARSSSPARFNALCNILSAVMRKRYQIDDDNKFDAIKSTLHYDDRDDLTYLYETSDGLINDNHRGVLATMPLSGAMKRPDPQSEINAFVDFAKRDKFGHFIHAIPEMHLWSVLQRLDASAYDLLNAPDPSPSASPSSGNLSSYESSEGSKKPATETPIQTDGTASASPASAFSPSGNLSSYESSDGRRQAARERLIDKARNTTSGKNRMRFVCSLFFYEYHRYPVNGSELVSYYEERGFARNGTNEKKRQVRLRRADEVISDHLKNPAKVPNSYTKADWLPLIKQYVTEDVRKHAAVKYGYRVDDDLLAAGLCLFTLNAFTKNRSDRMHTCSQPAQQVWYEKLSAMNTLKAKHGDKRKRVAVGQLLQLAGLIVLRDSEYKYGGKDAGIGNKYGIGPNHPRFAEFVHLFGDIRDPKALPIMTTKTAADAA